ncbi:MAG: hypothetical protein GXW85_10535 [Clostridia bacterium]|nr:hypothetical protein [Clostridia bacterium]
MAASLVKGILLNQETKEYLPYEIIVLDISWKEKLMAIQDQVYDQLLIAKYQNLADNLPKDDLYEDAYNLLLKWINKLKNELAQLRAQSSTGFQQQQNIMNALENLAEKLQEEYLDALEKGDLDKAAELKKDLDVINQQIANLGNSNTDSYQNLLAKKQELEQKIANAQGDEKAALENQLSDVLTQLKIA